MKSDDTDFERLREEVERLPRSIEPPRDLWPSIAARIESHDATAGGANDAAGPLPTAGSEAHYTGPSRSRSFFGSRIGLAAAALLLVALSSGITAVLMRGGPVETAGGPRPGGGATATPIGFGNTAWREFRGAEAQYQQIVGELEAVLDARRNRLSPETVRILDENLRIIDEALEDARTALERDPNNGGIAQQLEDVYRKKVNFLRQVQRLPV